MVPAAAQATKAPVKTTKHAAKGPKLANGTMVAEPKKETKMNKPREIYKAMTGKPRKDVLTALMKDAKLTKAGSATYYNLLPKG